MSEDASGNSSEIGDELESAELSDIRSRLRDDKFIHRERQREVLMKKIRFIGEFQPVENISKDEFIRLVKKLKQKNQISCDVLHAIMNTLLDSKENINAFMNISGALHALLSCLSGQNEKFQLFAACCICNLALGDEKTAFQVLKASDSYLFAHLSGKNCYVMEVCAIALGNLSTHGPKHIHMILAQGFLPKIKQLLMSGNDMLMSSCIYALTQVVYHGFDTLREEDIKLALESIITIFEKESSSLIFVLSVLTSHKSTEEIVLKNSLHIRGLLCLLMSLKNNEKGAVYYLRLVSNCLSMESGKMALEIVQQYKASLKECVELLLHSDKQYLKKECIATIGILLNSPIGSIREFGEEIIKEHLETIQAYLTQHHEEMDLSLT